MSGALTRLREVFQDELFIRSPTGMQPTPAPMTWPAPSRRRHSNSSQIAPIRASTPSDAISIAQADNGVLEPLGRLLRLLDTAADIPVWRPSSNVSCAIVCFRGHWVSGIVSPVVV